MTTKKKQPKTSVGGFDQLDAVTKPIKRPTRETPVNKIKRPKSAKRPK